MRFYVTKMYAFDFLEKRPKSAFFTLHLKKKKKLQIPKDRIKVK